MKSPKASRIAGFTLIEVLIAIAITSAVMLTVSAAFITTLRSHREVESLTESTQAGSRILNLIERDLKSLWIYNIQKNKVLIGRNMDINGQSADRIDFVSSTDSISTVLDVEENPAHTSVNEVGYWLKRNNDRPLLMELWRREDPMIDDDLIEGGRFQKVHDRLRSFNITYFETLGREAEEFHEWDSSEKDKLPRVIKIEFTIERKLVSANEATHEVEDFEDNNKKYTHFIVLEKEYMDILKPDVALIPVLPTRPEKVSEEGGAGGAGGEKGGPAGPAGPGGKGGGRGDNAMKPVISKEGEGRGKRGGGDRGGNRGGNAGGNRGGSGGMPPGFFGGGQGQNIDINQLFRQFGGGGR